MPLSTNLLRAISFATLTHEINQKQKRKGKDIAYITHPLTVGLILAHAGASEDVIIAGILHDAIEDSTPENKVTSEMIAEKFGQSIADLVLSVTEQNKDLPWAERKSEALRHIPSFSHDSLLVKSADVLANGTELVADHKHDGDTIFDRFNESKPNILLNQIRVLQAIVAQWPENPLVKDLRFLASDLQMIGAISFMQMERAPIIQHRDYDRAQTLTCPICHWSGTPETAGGEYYDALFDISCPFCDKMLLIVEYALASPRPTS